MRHFVKHLAQVVALVSWMASTGASAILLELDPAVASVSVGSGFDISIIVSGLQAASPAQIVSAFDLGLAYDPTQLQTQSATVFDNILGTGAFTGSDLSTSGRAEVFGFALVDDATLAALQGDSVTLAILHFLPLIEGVSSLEFVVDQTFQLVGRLDDAGFPTPLDANVRGGRVVITPASVPEPATVFLIALAFLAATVARRRRRPR